MAVFVNAVNFAVRVSFVNERDYLDVGVERVEMGFIVGKLY